MLFLVRVCFVAFAAPFLPEASFAQPQTPSPTPAKTAWETWADTVEARFRAFEERFVRSDASIKLTQKAVAEAIEGIKKTPEVVREKTEEIKSQASAIEDKQNAIQSTVDQVKAKQEQLPPTSVGSWINNVISAVAGIASLFAIQFVRNLRASLDDKTIVHAPEGGQVTIPNPKA